MKYLLIGIILGGFTVAAFAGNNNGPKYNGGDSSAMAVSGSAATSIAGAASKASVAGTQNASQGMTNTTQVSTHTDMPVASATAPALTASNGTCMGSVGAGIQFGGIGVSGGSTYLDEHCNRRYNAQQLHTFGHGDAALALMCSDPGVAKAMQAVGKLCPGAEVKSEAVTTVDLLEKAVKAEDADLSDPYIRMRLGLD